MNNPELNDKNLSNLCLSIKYDIHKNSQGFSLLIIS